jgi:hypothetical protein
MSFEGKANRVLEHARQLAGDVRSWADFSAALFDQRIGYVAKAFPTEIERQMFLESDQSKQIDALLISLMGKLGVVGGSRLTKSGKFVVRVPKSVHYTLEIEAKREGVSLNQLAVAKLTLPLQSASGMAADLIVRAFNEVHGGYSTDWIIVNSEFNSRFLDKCADFGLTQSPCILNHSLMNIRKNPKYIGKLNPTTKRSGFTDYDGYAFAAEIAVREIQRTEGVSLDRILCDPALTSRFDRLALELADDQTELKLRCAALNLRKTRRLKPKPFDQNACNLVVAGPIHQSDLSSLTESPGGYALYDENRPIFAGETENVRKRIGLHLKYGMPSWLGLGPERDLLLKTTALPFATRNDRLDWLRGYINSERPLLNYQNAA